MISSATAGISSGLSQAGAALGGAGGAARRAVWGLGIRGLDAGFGCGVGIGYGWGVVLKPSALEDLGRAAGACICACLGWEVRVCVQPLCLSSPFDGLILGWQVGSAGTHEGGQREGSVSRGFRWPLWPQARGAEPDNDGTGVVQGNVSPPAAPCAPAGPSHTGMPASAAPQWASLHMQRPLSCLPPGEPLASSL